MSERIKISDNILELQVLAERIRVLGNDLKNGYFGKAAKEKQDIWRYTGDYYEDARIKLDIITSMVYELEDKLDIIQNEI